jgi:antitoxin component of RelBE/YafQ-DinJ toxin-antitoxin module
MNTTLTVKLPKDLAAKAKKTAAALGIPMTTVVNSMLANFVREQSITLAVHPVPRPEKIAEWNKMGDDMDTRPEKYPVYKNVDELFARWDKSRAAKRAPRAKKVSIVA